MHLDNSRGHDDAFEHFSAVNFFAEFANDVPRFRHYITGSAGMCLDSYSTNRNTFPNNIHQGCRV
jgi:hypothetical protein